MEKYSKNKEKTSTLEAAFRQEILQFSKSEKLAEMMTAVKYYVKDKMKNVKSNQLRNIYKDISSRENATQIQLSRAFLAYTAGRNNTIKDVILFFDDIITMINDNEKLENFKIFMESVLSYHKFYFGEN